MQDSTDNAEVSACFSFVMEAFFAFMSKFCHIKQPWLWLFDVPEFYDFAVLWLYCVSFVYNLYTDSIITMCAK